MATRIQLRRDTAANWTSNNPTLANGEMGVETDTFKFKIGNGSTAWNALQYASSTSSYADSDVNAHLNTSTAASGEYLSWNGSDYSWDSVSAGYADSDVGAHLNVISAVSGQFLSWNGTDFAWSNNPLAINADIGSPPSPDQHFEFDGDTTNAAGSDALTLGTSVTYGTGYDGTANSAVILNSSKTVTLNSPSITAEDDDFFIGLWFKSDGSAFPTNGALLSTGFSGSNLLQIMVTVNDDTTPSLSLADYTSGWTRAIASTQPTWTDWNHYAISRSGDSVYLYLNGVPVATQSASGDTYPTGLWLFGRYTTTVGGSYDDWRFYASSPITHNTEFNPEAIGGSSAKIAEIQATGNTTNSTLTFKQYESGVLTSYPIYKDTSVDAHLNVDSATSGQFLSWNGTDYAWDSASSGGGSTTLSDSFQRVGPTSVLLGEGSYGIDSDFTFEIDFIMPSDNVYRNLFALGANSGTQYYGALYAYTTNSDGFVLLSSVSGTTTDGDIILNQSGSANFNGRRHVMTIVRGGAKVAVWVDGTRVAYYNGTISWPAGAFSNPGLALFAYGDGSIIQADGTGVEVYATSFTPEALYNPEVTTINTELNSINNELVDNHLNVDSATSGQFLSWNGTDYAWDSVSASPWTDNTSYVTYVGDVVIGRDISPDNVNSNFKGITVAGPYGGGINFQNSLGNQLAGRIFGNLANLSIRPGIGGRIELEDPSGADVLKINNDKTVQFAGAFTFPNTDGTANQVLTTNGSGTVTWADVGGGGLDSAAVAALIDSDLQNPTILTIGSSSSRIAIGSGASTGNFRAIGIGDGATATGTDAVAVGYNTLADGSTSVAIGNGADAGGGSAVAIGSNSNASNTSDTSVGLRANSTGGSATAIGSDADATGSRSTAVGNSSQSTAANTTTLGWGANANVTNSTAIGYVSNASGTKSSSLGTSANASGDYSIAIGADTTASGNNSISISAGTSSFTNSNVNGIDIRTSDSASIHYSQDSDFVFGAGVTMTDLVSTGATIVFNNLPTSDPVNAGQLWNDAGTLKVSAG